MRRPRTLYDQLRWGMIFLTSAEWCLVTFLIIIHVSGEGQAPTWMVKAIICAAIVMTVAVYFCVRHGDNLMKEMKERER